MGSGLALYGIPRRFDPRRVSPGNLKAWYDFNLPRNGGVTLADTNGITICEDLANPGSAFFDSFTRADSALTLGAQWTASIGTWGISSNKAYAATNADGSLAVTESGLADGVVECVVNGDLDTTGSNFSIPRVVIRMTDSNNFLMVSLQSGTIQLRKLDANSDSSLSSVATTTSDNTDYSIRVVMNGNSVKASKDGTQLIDYTLAGGDTKYASYTKHGMRLVRGGTPSFNARWDNFIVAKLSDHVQSTASQKLAYTLNAKNSRAGGRATAASSQRMQTAAFATAIAQPLTIMVAGKFGGNAQTLIDGIGASNQARIGAEAGGWTINGGTAISAGTTDTDYHVFVATFNGASSELRVDGTQAVSGDAGAQSLTGLTIAANQALGSFLDGDELVALVYSGALSESQKRKLESHYGRTYGISITWA